MKEPTVNLGQSQFLDAFMVVGAVETPYRRLRQIELEIRGLEDAIKQNEFTIRRNKVKLEKLGDSELEIIDAEEIEWNNGRSESLLKDCVARLNQFRIMKEQLIASVDESYWEAGFEAAECEHWPIKFGKQMAFEIAATGHPSLQLGQQISLLPANLQIKCMNECNTVLPTLLAPERRLQLVAALIGEDKMKLLK